MQMTRILRISADFLEKITQLSIRELMKKIDILSFLPEK